MNIFIQSWKKKSQELYNYETEDISAYSFLITNSVNIYNYKDKIRIQNQNDKFKLYDSSKVSSIEKNNSDYYYLSNFKNKENYEKSFFILRNLLKEDKDENEISKKYEINIGDVIKIGCFYIKVKNLVIDNKKITTNQIFMSENNINTNKVSFNVDNFMANAINKKKICRVCYEEENESPLISPCKCSGGLRYIHLKCLQNWIYSQSTNLFVEKGEDNFNLIYNIKKVNCELCKEPYPDYIYNSEKKIYYDIFDFIPIEFKSYIVLESIPNKNKEDQSRIFFILNFDDKNNIILGRSHEVDVIINEISISRFHCELSIDREKNAFYIRDLDSKFGTGVLIQNKKILLNDKKLLFISIGKHILEIKKRKSCFCLWNLFCNFCCCNNENNSLYEIYGKENKNNIEVEKIFNLKKSKEDDNLNKFFNNYYQESEYTNGENSINIKKNNSDEILNIKPNTNNININNNNEIKEKLLLKNNNLIIKSIHIKNNSKNNISKNNDINENNYSSIKEEDSKEDNIINSQSKINCIELNTNNKNINNNNNIAYNNQEFMKNIIRQKIDKKKNKKNLNNIDEITTTNYNNNINTDMNTNTNINSIINSNTNLNTNINNNKK